MSIESLYEARSPLFFGRDAPLAEAAWVDALWSFAREHQTSAVSLTRLLDPPSPLRALEAYLFHQQPEVLVQWYRLLEDDRRAAFTALEPELAGALEAAAPEEPTSAVTSLGNIARAWTGTGRQLLETAEEDWTPRIRALSKPERQEAHLIVRRVVTSKKLKDRVVALADAWDAT